MADKCRKIHDRKFPVPKIGLDHGLAMSSLVEGDEGLFYTGTSGKLLCFWLTPKNYSAHAWQHSINVWLFCWSSCSSPSTKELHGLLVRCTSSHDPSSNPAKVNNFYLFVGNAGKRLKLNKKELWRGFLFLKIAFYCVWIIRYSAKNYLIQKLFWIFDQFVEIIHIFRVLVFT